MRSLFFACCSLLCLACDPPPPAGDPDAGSRPDASDAATDGGRSGDTGNTSMDASDTSIDVGSTPHDAGDASSDAASGADAQDGSSDGSSVDARDASTDANDIVNADTGAAVVPDATVLGCDPSTHLSGDPLGTSYDWMGCGGTETRGTGSIWTYNLVVVDGGIGFFHAPSISSGSAGQSVVGTFLLPPPSVAAPLAVVCSGNGSTIDVDAAGAVTGLGFRSATTLHTTGSDATGGLVITIGSPSTIDGDLGTHHFASAAATTFGTYDATGANMTMTIGTTALSLVLARNVDAIMIGVAQVASGSTTDVYTFGSGTATSTTVTLPATVSLLGTCDGAGTGTRSLDGTITH